MPGSGGRAYKVSKSLGQLANFRNLPDDIPLGMLAVSPESHFCSRLALARNSSCRDGWMLSSGYARSWKPWCVVQRHQTLRPLVSRASCLVESPPLAHHHALHSSAESSSRVDRP